MDFHVSRTSIGKRKMTLEKITKTIRRAGMGLAMLTVVAGCADSGSKNYRPEITSSCPTEVDEGQPYSCQVTATDKNKKDRDRLTYTLPYSPEGMVIDSSNGLISWMAFDVVEDTPSPFGVQVCDKKGKCSEIQDNDLVVKNATPETTISEPDFGNGLTGTYSAEVCAEDDNGIDYVELWTNGAYNKYMNAFNENPYCFNVTPSIIPANNTLEVIAVDDEGIKSEIASRSFYSPTEEEARGEIDEILSTVPNGGITKDSSYTAPSDGINTIMVDYIVEPLPSVPSGDVIIEYVSHSDDLSQEMEDKQYLDSYGVPNRYFARLPLSEIESRFNEFINNNWQ